jgi:hypothetical protein
MRKKYTKKLFAFSILALFVVFLVVFFSFISPTEIVNKIGVKNAYIIVFLVSFFGGFSAGGSITFITLLVTLTIGGMNPIYLGLISGISLAIGDMIMFYAGCKGRELIRGKLDKRINKITKFINKRKGLEKTIPIIAYLYIGFAPLPNDILILFLSVIEYPRKKMNIIIILGDITFALMVTILTSMGVMIFV